MSITRRGPRSTTLGRNRRTRWARTRRLGSKTCTPARITRSTRLRLFRTGAIGCPQRHRRVARRGGARTQRTRRPGVARTGANGPRTAIRLLSTELAGTRIQQGVQIERREYERNYFCNTATGERAPSHRGNSRLAPQTSIRSRRARNIRVTRRRMRNRGQQLRLDTTRTRDRAPPLESHGNPSRRNARRLDKHHSPPMGSLRRESRPECNAVAPDDSNSGSRAVGIFFAVS